MSRQPLLCAVFLMIPLWLPAQSPADTFAVGPGARLRVTVDSGRPQHLIGVLGAQWPDSLWLRRSGLSTLTIPRNSIIQLEVNRGRKSYAGLGAVLGVFGGFGAGYLVLSGKSYTGHLGNTTPVFELLASMGAGGIIGGIVGANAHPGRWYLLPRAGLELRAP
jgi:hypothetical protein